MTEEEIWDAKWLAFKLVVTGNVWHTTYERDSGRVADAFPGDRILMAILNTPDPAAKPMNGYNYTHGIGEHSAMAKAFAATGIALEDAPKLRAAAKRSVQQGGRSNVPLP